MGMLLKAVRRQAGFSQEDLGSKLGISFQQIQKYEKGVNRITAGRLQQMADILNVPVSYFYGGGTKAAAPHGVKTILRSVGNPTALRILRAYTRLEKEKAHQLVVFMEGIAG